MKRFVFRLARLERIRDIRRRRTRAMLAQALGAEREAAVRREKAEELVEEAARAMLPPDLAQDPTALRQKADWIAGRRELARRAAELEIEATEAVARASERYDEDARAHRVLERLRERRFDRWAHEAATEEQKQLDEAYLLRFPARAARKGETE